MKDKPTKEEIIQIQRKFVSNIINYCEVNGISIEDISNNCDLDKERIKGILDLNSERIITLSTFYILSKGVGIPFEDVFKTDVD